MRISEKQLSQLLVFCHQMISPNAMLTEKSRDVLRDLLINIANQQSEELMDIE